MYNGKPIKDKRKELGLSAQELGELIGVKEWGNIYKWEKGTKPHDPEDFQKIQNWLSGKTVTVTNSKNGSVVSNKPQHGDNSENTGIDPVKEVGCLNDQQITIAAKVDVIFDVVVEMLAATKDGNATLIRKQLLKRVDELKKFAQ